MAQRLSPIGRIGSPTQKPALDGGRPGARTRIFCQAQPSWGVGTVPGIKNEEANDHSNRSPQARHGDDAVIVIKNPVRERDREHLRFVASQPCLGRTPSDAHHVKFAEPRAMGRKVSDKLPFPFAGCTIASCTGVAMSAPGGRIRGSIPSPLQQPFGPERMQSDQLQNRPRSALNSNQVSTNGIPSTSQVPRSDLKTTKRSQSLARTQDEYRLSDGTPWGHHQAL